MHFYMNRMKEERTLFLNPHCVYLLYSPEPAIIYCMKIFNFFLLLLLAVGSNHLHHYKRPTCNTRQDRRRTPDPNIPQPKSFQEAKRIILYVCVSVSSSPSPITRLYIILCISIWRHINFNARKENYNTISISTIVIDGFIFEV